MQDNACKCIADMQSKYKERYDQHRYEGLKYSVGDIVYVKTIPISTGESTKLQSRYKRPLMVVEVLPGDTYRISGIAETSKRHQTTAHESQLKLWKNYNSEEEMNQTDEMEKTDTEEWEDGVRNCNERSRRKAKYSEDYTE
ncbi:hypothetical protein Trydic_g296 [Trypoxylus dichotomus]